MIVRAQAIAAVEVFLFHNPKASNTFAHIVLDDLNLSNEHILFCLRQDTINDWFEHELALCEHEHANPESSNHHERWQYDNLTELRDTIISFLRYLLTTPERIRD